MEKRVHSALPTAGLAITLVVLALLAAAPLARAQEGGDNPPEILTSDLALKTVLESDRLEVNFVIVDTDKVTRVTIDGDEQSFEPADTVMLSRNFVFRQDVTRVRVSATDEAGHTRTVIYTVFRPGVDMERAEAKAQAAEGRYFGQYDARLEYDSNPSNETSVPFKIAGVSVTGNAEPDIRFNAGAYGGYSKGNLTGFVGGNLIEYSDDLNNQFDLQVIFLGGILALPRGETTAFELSYLFADVNVGNDNYDQMHTVGVGYRSASAGAGGGSEITLYQFEVSRKQMSEPNDPNADRQQDSNVFALKWDYTLKKANKLDEYRRRVFVGIETEGLMIDVDSDGVREDASAYNYYGADWGWHNAWDSGLLFDIDLGVEYRRYRYDVANFPELKLGDRPASIPMFVAPSVGWQFSPKMRLLGHFEYRFDLSNKSPYVRYILGVGAEGKF